MSYTFSRVNVGGYYRDVYKVDVADVIICKYCDNYYFIHYSWGTAATIDVDERDKNFEAMFPVFPYEKTKSGELTQASRILQLKNQVKHLEQRIDKMENDITKLLSHVEAIMTVLRQRLPTDELLTL